MKIYHVTNMGNLPGIVDLGLQPGTPRLSHHQKAFDALYKKGTGRAPGKYLYAWEFKTDKRTEKIAKDVAYWHVWGWRLNDMIEGQGDRVDLSDRRYPEMRTTIFAVLTAHVPKTAPWVLLGDFNHDHWAKSMYYRVYKRMDRRRQHTEPIVLVTRSIPAHLIRLWATILVNVKRKDRRWHLTTAIHRYQDPKPLKRRSS